MTDTDDDRFVEQTRQTLRHSENELDADVQSRLRLARRQAIASIDEERRPSWMRPWVFAPIGGMAAVALAVGIYLGQGGDALSFPGNEEFTVAQDMELLEELEFVAWMVLENERASG